MCLDIQILEHKNQLNHVFAFKMCLHHRALMCTCPVFGWDRVNFLPSIWDVYVFWV